MTNNGAIDNDWDDGERSYDERLAKALAGVQTEPMPGGYRCESATRRLA